MHNNAFDSLTCSAILQVIYIGGQQTFYMQNNNIPILLYSSHCSALTSPVKRVTQPYVKVNRCAPGLARLVD